MSTTPGPVRHDIMFSMSEASKERVDLLLRQCGHTNLNLLLARGLALVQWVEDQGELGRTIGAVTYGDENVDVFELVERPELLKPQPRPQSLTAPKVEPPAPVAEDKPAPKPEPVPASAPAIDPAKLVARPKSPPPPAKRPTYRNPSGREQVLRAHIPNDVTGPVKSHSWVRWDCEMQKRLPPIRIGDDRALPGELTLEHLPELERMSVDARHATHFLLTKDGFLAFYGYQAGNGKRGGWCYVEEGSMQLRKDESCDAGIFAIFPVVMAVEYLRRLANPPREVASA